MRFLTFFGMDQGCTKKIDDVFGHTLSNSDKRSLATLIYYPKEKMEVVKSRKKTWRTGTRSHFIV